MWSWLRSPWVRYGLVAIVLACLAYALRDNAHFLHEGWAALKRADNRYIAVAVLFTAVTMIFQAEMMVSLLHATGVPCGRGRANALGLAANSWSATLPGGPAVAAAMIFREQMAWGASAVVASWYMVVSGLLAAAGMALLGLIAVFFLGASVHPVTLGASIAGLAAVLYAVSWAARNPAAVEAWLLAALRRFNRLVRAPEDRWTDKLSGLRTQLRAVDIPLSRLVMPLIWATLKWVAEIVCLWACVVAVGGHPDVAGVALSFLAAKLVGQAQITPGGLGPVDVMLTSTLVALGSIPTSLAVAAAIVFRMLTFVLLAAVGWVVFLWCWVLRARTSPESKEKQ
ncbi:lysylphosphatidylglycerol synthase transmembrane domain-containing protein [Corynebacterium mastitidis]|uniref:lysylphosphatidylglycerol synthase transmembrane domain-containing protein n=1 Tax=Corynebacterium mastitidis TaxID=161890 RepID=UPI0003826EB9|nr:YbhN family protein [Corynebacterium mastitidis]